jgi:hypothetical protein
MARSKVQSSGGSVKSGIETAVMRQVPSSYSHEIVGGRVVSLLTGRVLLIQPPPDKPKVDPRRHELEVDIDRVLEDEKRLREAKKLGLLSIAGIDGVPNDLSGLRGAEVTVRELVPAS